MICKMCTRMSAGVGKLRSKGFTTSIYPTYKNDSRGWSCPECSQWYRRADK